MNINYISKNTAIRDQFRERSEKKLAKLDEVFSVFLRNKGMKTVRAAKFQRRSSVFLGREQCLADPNRFHSIS